MRTGLDCGCVVSSRTGRALKRCAPHRKAATAEQDRRYRAASPEKYRERVKTWHAANREWTQNYMRDWGKEHRGRHKKYPSRNHHWSVKVARYGRPMLQAHAAVQKALASGRLTRGPCERCGAIKAQAHHDDYAKPLDVRWLCSPCHWQVHHAA